MASDNCPVCHPGAHGEWCPRCVEAALREQAESDTTKVKPQTFRV